MSYNARNSHGTVLQIGDGATPTEGFTTIAELGDLDLPELDRNMYEWTCQTDDDDAFIAGEILRKGELSVPIAFIDDNPTHDHSTGLLSLMLSAARKNYRVLFTSGRKWNFAAYVKNFKGKAPVDGILMADVKFRPSGAFTVS